MEHGAWRWVRYIGCDPVRKAGTPATCQATGKAWDREWRGEGSTSYCTTSNSTRRPAVSVHRNCYHALHTDLGWSGEKKTQGSGAPDCAKEADVLIVANRLRTCGMGLAMRMAQRVTLAMRRRRVIYTSAVTNVYRQKAIDVSGPRIAPSMTLNEPRSSRVRVERLC